MFGVISDLSSSLPWLQLTVKLPHFPSFPHRVESSPDNRYPKSILQLKLAHEP